MIFPLSLRQSSRLWLAALLVAPLLGCMGNANNASNGTIAINASQSPRNNAHVPAEQAKVRPQQVPQTQSSPASNASQSDAICTTAQVQTDILSRINRVRAAGAVCGATRYPPAGPLRWSTTLQQAAALHAQDMARHNFFNHKSASNGSTMTDRLRVVGYKFQTAGENIGAGPSSAAQIVDVWVASPGHCANLMTAEFAELGVSCQSNSHSAYKNYWTMKIATPS